MNTTGSNLRHRFSSLYLVLYPVGYTVLDTKIAITVHELMNGHYNLKCNGKTEVQLR